MVRTKPQRIDPDFYKDLTGAAKTRFFKNLERKLPTLAETTRLARRTNSWKGVLRELETKPRKEDIQ